MNAGKLIKTLGAAMVTLGAPDDALQQWTVTKPHGGMWCAQQHVKPFSTVTASTIFELWVAVGKANKEAEHGEK